MAKDSFIIYKSFYEPIKSLSDKQLGRLFRALFDYQIEGSTQVDTDIYMAFSFFKNQMDIDEGKYQKIVERNKQNGSKGGRPPKEKNPKNPMGFKKPKKPYNDNVNDNVNVNEDEDDNVGRNFPLDPEIEKRIGLNSLKPLNEVFNELDNNQQWKEAICMNHSIPGSTVQIRLNNLKILLNEFYNHLSGDMQVKEKSLQDTYSHFSNWLRKKKEYERK